MTPEKDRPVSANVDRPSERELSRTQREVNEALVLSSLRAHEQADAAEVLASEAVAREDVLRQGEAQLRALADTMPLLAWYANPNGDILWYNRRWFQYTATTLDQQEGWKWRSAHDPDDWPRVVAKWKAALASGELWEDELRLRRHDGQYRWFLSRAAPMRDTGGRIVRWFGTHVDIDEQKHAEEDLRRRSSLAMLAADVARAFTLGGPLRAALDHCCSAIVRQLDVAVARIWAVDRDGTTLELCASAGLLSPPLARARVGELKAGWIAASREPLLTNDVEGDRRIDEHEWACRQGMVSFAGYPLVMAGQLVGVLSMFARRRLDDDVFAALASMADTIAIGIERQRKEEERDRLLVSEQEARKDAEAANRMKDEFLATMSHELRTPLGAILGWSSMLRRGHYDENGIDRALATIERNAKTQARLIEDMLDVSRIISGKLRLEMRRVDMNGIALAALDVVRPAADAKRLRLVFEPAPEGLERLVGDADRLQQVAWNLLSNAVKFTPPEGTVSVRVERVGSTERVVVRDTGPGIAREHLPFVFDRFRQVDSSTTRRFGGLGLGLAIVRHLVEMHGGSVRVDSGGPGLGSTFTVSLPVHALQANGGEAETTAKVEAKAEAELPPSALAGVKVLVVDDDEDTRLLIGAALERVGASVDAVDSARAAIDFIETHPVDVMVSDIGMPVEDGFSLMKRVRTLPASRGGQVPALALTAYARREDVLRAHQAGYQCHLAKPANIDELTRSVARLATIHPLGP